MGLLDDAIREHLELKRRRGADPEEVTRQENEALGAARRAEFARPEGGDAPAEAGEPGAAGDAPAAPFDHGAGEPSAPPEPAAGAPAAPFDAEPRHEPAEPAPPRHEPVEPAPPRHDPFAPAERAPDEPFARSEPAVAPREPVAAPDEPVVEAQEPVEAGDEREPFDVEADAPPAAAPTERHEPPAGAPTERHEPPAEAPTERHDWLEDEPDEVPAEEALDHPRPAEAAEGEDVLEETPDFLQETPEHDRLWFEQRPPRDFDWDK